MRKNEKMDQPHRASAPHTPQEHPPQKGARVSQAVRSHRVSADLKAYLDGELPAWKRGLVARHIRRCASCRAESQVLERLSRHAQNLGRLDQAVPSPQLRARILASLPDAAPARPAPRPERATFAAMLRNPQWAMGSLCAALLLFFLGSAYARNHWEQASATAPNPSTPAASPALPDRQASLVSRGANGENKAAAGQNKEVPVRSNTGDPFSPSVAVGEAMFPNAAHSSIPNTSRTASNSSSHPALEADPSQETASVPPAETYNDPISREAARLAEQPIKEKLKEKQHEKEQQIAAAKALPARPDPRLAVVRNGAAGGTQLAFAVADVAQARQQVQKWAAESGVEMTVLADTASRTGGFPTASSGAVGNAPEEEAPALLKLRVPAQRAESFKSCLSQVGTPLPSGSARRGGGPVRPIMAEEITPRPVAQALPAFTPDKAVGGETKQTFTVTLRLQAGARQP